MRWPRITIVTPSFNQGRFLDAAICSVLEQGYPNLQYGVVDGGSSDESIDIINGHRHHLDFAIIESDDGQSHAINKGLSRADGDIIAWLNSDDTLEPQALHFVGEYFYNQPNVNWLIGASRAIDGDDRALRLIRPAGQFTLYGALRRSMPFEVPQPSTFWRRELTDHVGLLDESLHYCMDLELWCRFLAAGYEPVVSDQILASYRFHEASKSCAHSDQFISTLMTVERRHLHQLKWYQRLNMRRIMSYQHRAHLVRTARHRPWGKVMTHPWWLGSQQILKLLIRGPAPPQRCHNHVSQLDVQQDVSHPSHTDHGGRRRDRDQRTRSPAPKTADRRAPLARPTAVGEPIERLGR